MRGSDGPRFYRDPSLFQRLREHVLPRLLGRRQAPFRFWVAGCGTGEDAYALAIELLSFVADTQLRVFATDIDAERLEFARTGAYDDDALAHVDEELRRTYFSPFAGRQRVAASLRRCIVFARHDLVRDPPFSNMDLAVCFGVLPSLSPPRREKALAALHCAVRQPGFVLTEELGVGSLHPLVAAQSAQARGAAPSAAQLASHTPESLRQPPLSGELELARGFDRVVMQDFAPPCLLVNEALTVLQTRGDLTKLFGETGAGNVKLSVVVGEGLAAPLAQLARAAFLSQGALWGGAFSRAQPDGSLHCFDVWAIPLGSALDRSRPLAIVFAPRRLPEIRYASSAPSDGDDLREHLAALSYAHAHATRELRAANAELSASIEDLHCLNEELRTAQEQLLSNNDELSDLNQALMQRNAELQLLYRDLSNLFTTAERPIVILDRVGNIRRFSDHAQQLVSVRESDIGRPLDDLRLHVAMPELGDCVRRVIETGSGSDHEVRDRDGCWHRLTIRPYRGADEQVDGVVVSLFDIDALKASARRAELASQEAERANRAKDEFLATLSHELRSPLHGVLVYTQLLRRGALRGEKVQQAATAIEDGVSLLVQLLDELLDVSRIVNGKFALRRHSVELVDVVARVLEASAKECASKQLHVQLPESLRVAGDAARLQQVVANLLSNALKFTRPDGAIEVTLEQDADAARLHVRDDGVGIDADFLPHVFERFTQGDGSLTREFGGLGLGLHIVRQIVELHGGTVCAASAGPGRGASFSVTLPLARDLPSEPARAEAKLQLLDGLRILVVDDDAVARTAVSELLSHAGAEVLSAPSAAAALEAVCECEPVLLVCDIAMPEEDGYALIERVRALEEPSLARIPALALTAFARESDRERALAAGYQEHLAKPVDVELLMQVLSTLYARSRADSGGR